MNREQFFRRWAIIATLVAVVFLNTTLFFAYRANKYESIRAAEVIPSDSQTLGASASNSLPVPDTERLVLAYANLRNAELAATGDVVLSKESLLGSARSMSKDELRKECSAIADHMTAMLPSIQGSPLTETFAYFKNAMMRLTLDREEDHVGHVRWASRNRDQVRGAMRECAQKIREALQKT